VVFVGIRNGVSDWGFLLGIVVEIVLGAPVGVVVAEDCCCGRTCTWGLYGKCLSRRVSKRLIHEQPTQVLLESCWLWGEGFAERGSKAAGWGVRCCAFADGGSEGVCVWVVG